MYDIGIRYRIPITMEHYDLMLSYVRTVPWIYLISLLKGYPSWNRSFQRNGKTLQSKVEVFLIEVHPIWHTTQEGMKWSRIGSRELSCKIILVHVITLIDRVHISSSRSSLLSIDDGRGTLAPALEKNIYIGTDIVTISAHYYRARSWYWGRSKKTLLVHSILNRYRIKTVDIEYD